MDSGELDYYLTHWGVGDLVPFRDYIRNASLVELRDLCRQIKAHAKERKESARLFAHINPGMRSPHAEALAAVNWELRKRSKLNMWLGNTIFPIRKWWAGFWSSTDLKQTDDFGPQPFKREGWESSFYMYGFRRWSLEIVILPVLRYLGRNAKWIVPAIVAVLIAIYVT